MNEQPEFDRSDVILVCMKDGKFLAEESDGHATWNNWVESPLYAKVFHPVIVYGQMADWSKANLDKPLKEPGYYQFRPAIPVGASMVKLKLNITGWHKGSGPIQTTASQDRDYYK